MARLGLCQCERRLALFRAPYRLRRPLSGELSTISSGPLASQNPQLTLVLGGARSGKSRYAEQVVMASPSPWVYVATAEPFDDEMKARIAEHRSRRGGEWQPVETQLDLAGAISNAPAATAVLVDCLTLWLSNLM